MAESLKTKGREELAALRKRIVRQYSLGRISKPTQDRMLKKVDELDAEIISCDEEIPARLRKRYL